MRFAGAIYRRCYRYLLVDLCRCEYLLLMNISREALVPEPERMGMKTAVIPNGSLRP